MNDSWSEKDDAEFEENLFLQVLTTRSSEIAKSVIAYGLVLDLLNTFERIYPQYDNKLDEYYLRLCELIGKNIEAVESEIDLHYNSDGPNNFPDFYINTGIFDPFKHPFANIRDAKINDEWNERVIELRKSYGLLRELSHKAGLEDYTLEKSDQDSFDGIKRYIRGFTILECGNLRLDLEKSILQFGSNEPKTISLSSQTVKFLIILLKSEGKIVEYVDIAKRLNLNLYHEGLKNEHIGDAIRYLKRDLRTLLKEVGMPDVVMSSFITIITNVGYKLNCDKSQ